MKIKLFSWLGREFVEIVGEGKAGVTPEKAVNELFKRFEAELQLHGLSLDNTARIRVGGKDRDARTLATAARAKVLSGKRRAASSRFISAEWFDSDALAGLELLAMRPLDGAAARNPVDFEPARNYLCYLEYDGCFFSRVSHRKRRAWKNKLWKFLPRSATRWREHEPTGIKS